jgi:phenylacetate-coenzyme A ligase PaaK-like adenylate-forming protein
MSSVAMGGLEFLFSQPQYSLRQSEKEQYLLPLLDGLTRHHQGASPAYARLLEAVYSRAGAAASLEEIPYLPVGLFKSHRLVSVADDRIFKTLTSSGTTGQQVSRVYLDSETAQRQTVALSRILQHVLGPDRLPMLVIDTSALLKNRQEFSARGAGVLGMMNFGRQHVYALDEGMNLNRDAVRDFLARFGGSPFLMFGFTFMVWKYFFQPLGGLGVDLSQGILIHSGGWKKLADEAVDNATFKARLRESTGLHRIYNFYGMVEQVGSVYMEGEDGLLYPPNFADVVIRDPRTWEPAPDGQPGVIQVLSALPLSYPGHSILTEDLGVVHSVDSGIGGRFGKAFSVIGRVPRSEVRGCSDTHQEPAVQESHA